LKFSDGLCILGAVTFLHFLGLGKDQLNLKAAYFMKDTISKQSLAAAEVRADLVKLEESRAAKDTATLALISRLCDELRERRASAG
jgi:hypothetical protein